MNMTPIEERALVTVVARQFGENVQHWSLGRAGADESNERDNKHEIEVRQVTLNEEPQVSFIQPTLAYQVWTSDWVAHFRFRWQPNIKTYPMRPNLSILRSFARFSNTWSRAPNRLSFRLLQESALGENIKWHTIIHGESKRAGKTWHAFPFSRLNQLLESVSAMAQVFRRTSVYRPGSRFALTSRNKGDQSSLGNLMKHLNCHTKQWSDMSLIRFLESFKSVLRKTVEFMGTYSVCYEGMYLELDLSLIHISEPTRPY